MRMGSGLIKTEKGNFFKSGKTGAPDCIGIYKGMFVGIEYKTAKGRQTKSQKEAQEKIEKLDGYYTIARSVDDLFHFFCRLDKEER